MAEDIRSLAICALDGEGRADRVSPVFHDAQTHSLDGANVSWEAGAIVGDGQGGAVPRTAQADDYGAGVPMLDRIRDRLLGDPIEVRCNRVAGDEDRSRAIKPAADVEELCWSLPSVPGAQT